MYETSKISLASVVPDTPDRARAWMALQGCGACGRGAARRARDGQPRGERHRRGGVGGSGVCRGAGAARHFAAGGRQLCARLQLPPPPA
eukprot:1184720-Prorocentrum_minimum.AAC.2